MYREPVRSTAIFFGSLRLAITAGPPSPASAALPFPATVWISPGLVDTTTGLLLTPSQVLYNRLAHFHGPDQLASRTLNVFGAIALLEGTEDSLLNGLGFFV